MKRILYFMPDLTLKGAAGNITRVLSLLEYFKSRNIEVDYFGAKGWNPYDVLDCDKMISTGLIKKLYTKEQYPSRKKKIKRFFLYKIPEMLQNWWYKTNNSALPNRATFYLKKEFDKILKNNEYDFIIINYTTWAGLMRNNKYKKNAYTIIDTHDLMSIQRYKKKKRNLGRIFEEEIKRLNFFNEIWAVSIEEMYIYNQFTNNQVRLIPIIPAGSVHKVYKYDTKEYDLIYVGSENEYNKEASNWFIREVYPLLPPDISIRVVGRIANHIDDKPNILKIEFVENLDDEYSKAKVAICPMLNGTGVKLKVIEAMAYGLPIISTLRGIDGLPNKINNGCLVDDTPEGFANNIKSVLTDNELYKKLSQQGQDIYLNYFSPEKVYKRLDEIFLFEKNK